MQRLPVNIRGDSFLMDVAWDIVQTAIFERVSVTVQMISYNGVSDIRQMDPDLMSPPGLQL